MKKLFALIALVFLLVIPARAQPFTIKYIYQYSTATVPPTNWFVLLDPGNGAYQKSTIQALGNVIGNFLNFTNAAITILTVTNNTFVNTNVFISTSNSFFNIAFVTNLTTVINTNNTFVNTNIFQSTCNAFFNFSYTTNFTIVQPGGATNLNLTPKSPMVTDINDAESSLPNAQGVYTNDGIGNMGFTMSLSLNEVDALNFYPTNTFTGKTNVAILATDGNGLLISGVPLSPTNILLSAGANITFITNGDGSITIAASGSVNITTITNTTIYSQTNYSTNLFFVSGKGNTLIVTNIAIYGTQTNFNIAASSAVITKSDQVLTNAVNAHGAFTNSATGPPSFGLLANTELQNSSLTVAGTANQVSVSGGGPVALGGTATLSLPSPVIAPGIVSATGLTNTGFAGIGVVTNDANGKLYTTPVIPNPLLANSSITIQGSAVALGGSTLAAGSAPFFDLNASTNLVYPTNAIPANAVLTESQGYTTNATRDITLPAPAFNLTAKFASYIIFVTNGDSATHTVTLTGVAGQFGVVPAVHYCTNAHVTQIVVQHYAPYTNSYKLDF